MNPSPVSTQTVQCLPAAAPPATPGVDPCHVKVWSCCAGWYGVDIGPRSAKAFAEAAKGCKTLFWNGPCGRYEVQEFAAGTKVGCRQRERAEH